MRRRPARCRGARRRRLGRAVAARAGPRGGRSATRGAGGGRQSARAPLGRVRPLRPPDRRGRLPSGVPRADGAGDRQRAARGTVGRAARGCARRPGRGLPALRATGERGAVPGHDDLRLRARAAARPGALARAGPAAAVARVRPALGAAARQARHDRRHGHDREAGRLGCPQQHDARRAGRRRLAHHRPQVVLLGADVRRASGAGADRVGPVLLPRAALDARWPAQRDPRATAERQAGQRIQRVQRSGIRARLGTPAWRGRPRHSDDPGNGDVHPAGLPASCGRPSRTRSTMPAAAAPSARRWRSSR